MVEQVHLIGAKAHCIPFKQPEELSSDAGCICRGWDNNLNIVHGCVDAVVNCICYK